MATVVLTVLLAALVFAAPSFAAAVGDDSRQISPVVTESGPAPQMEPLSTAYAVYVLKSLGPLAGLERGDYVPPPLTATPASSSGRVELQSALLPATYDLRTTGKLTPVRNQGSYGTCWAFATCGSVESGMMSADPQDFSEDNMALASGFFSAATDATTLYNSGGNSSMSTAYLARWTGPVYETDEPYGTGHVVPGLVARRHVQDVDMLSARTGPLDNDTIKTAIMEHGAVMTSMYWTSSAYRTSTHAFYYSGSGSSNHAIDLVGWDDNYSASNFAAAPAGNGAWIVRNSWGSSFGSGGYFYISYYDGVLAMSGSMVVETAEPATNYHTVLQYDTLGQTTSYGYGSPTAWMMNQFPVGSTSSLKAVAFYARTAGTTYEVYEGTGSLSRVATGTLAVGGYHTVALPTPVVVPAGSTMKVAVKLTTPGSNYPIPVEAMFTGYSDQATSAAGQGFMSSSGSAWTDMASRGSVCLKAFLDPASSDRTPPQTALSATPAPNAGGWYHSDVSASLVASDGESGVSATYYSLNSGSAVRYTGPVTVSAQGTNTLAYWSVDCANNAETTRTATFRLDTISPSTMSSQSPAANGAGWSRGPVTVSLDATDAGSGVDAVHYRLGSSAAATYSAPITVDATGVTTLEYWASDRAGGTEATHTENVRIDSEPPRVFISMLLNYVNVATIRPSVADTVSGVDRVEMSLDTTGSFETCWQLTTSVPGSHTVFVRAWDQAGNSAETSAQLNVERVTYATQLSRPKVSPATPSSRKNVRITAYVTPSAAALDAMSVVVLYHRETKRVTEVVGGRPTSVKVAYWRWRATHRTAATSAGRLRWTGKLAYAGRWRVCVRCSGSAFYLPSSSPSRSFSVR